MKKVFTLMTLLVAMVTGAWADSYTLGYADETKDATTLTSSASGTATFTCGTQVFTVTNSGSKTLQGANFKGSDDIKRYGVKYSQNVDFTITLPEGMLIESITFAGWANNTSAATVVQKINGTDVSGETGNSFGVKGSYNSWTYTFASPVTGSITFSHKGAEGVLNITLTEQSGPATKPIITKQPQNVEYTLESTDYPDMSVEATASAGTLSYQWELSETGEENTFDAIPATIISSAAAATLLGSEAITTLTTIYSVTEPTVFYIRCRVEDSNGWVYTNVVTLTYKAPIVPEAPTIAIAADNERTVSLKGSTNIKLVATVTGAPDPTIQWYSKEGEIITAVDGATSKEFSPATTGYGTFTYFAKATNASGTADSEPITVMVKPALQSVKFTNGAYGAITEPSALPTEGEPMGKIEVPFINGATAPEVDETSWTAFSDTKATITLAENKITVTSGTNTAVYEYQLIPVEPITTTTDIAKTNFTEVPAWVYNPYGYSWGEASKDQKGVRFAKVLDEANNMRVAKGNTRQYYFVGPAKSLTLTASPCATRKVNVYVNGTSFKADTDNNAIGAITLSETGANLVMIESNQTGGDGGFSAYAIVAADATGISNVKADAAAAGAKKYVKNGRLVIETARGTFNAAGVVIK